MYKNVLKSDKNYLEGKKSVDVLFLMLCSGDNADAIINIHQCVFTQHKWLFLDHFFRIKLVLVFKGLRIPFEELVEKSFIYNVWVPVLNIFSLHAYWT